MLQPANVDFDITRGDDTEVVFNFTDEAGNPLRLPASGLYVLGVEELYEPKDTRTYKGVRDGSTIAFTVSASDNLVNSRYLVRHIAANTRVTTYAYGYMKVRHLK